MNKQQKLRLVLFLLALSASIFFVFVNHSYLLKENEEWLRNGVTVITSDDASYLAPAKNFLKGGEWRSNQPGKVGYTLRSPGYGMIYAVFSFFASEAIALKILIAFQIVLFALAVCVIPGLYNHLRGGLTKNLTGYYLAVFSAVMPMFSGFLGYTLTEGVTPALVILFLFLLFDFHYSSRSFLLAALVLGFLILVRPAMIVWGVAPILLFFDSHNKTHRNKLLSIALIGLLPIGLWQINISIKTNEVQGLHPIYQDDANDLYRPLHRDIWNFHKSWGQTGYEFNNTVNRLWEDALSGNDSKNTIEKIIRRTPRNCVELIGYSELQAAYESYFEVLLSQVPYFENNKPIPHQNMEEIALQKNFKKFKKQFVSTYPLYSFIVVPAKVYFELAAHSNLTMYVFQKPWRGNILMEIFRYFAFATHFGVFAFFPIAVVMNWKNIRFLTIALPVVIYVGYLIFIQRGIEERYTLPVLLPIFLLVMYSLLTFYNRFKLKSASSV